MRNSQKMFLQSFMSRGILNAKDVFTQLKLACEKFGEPAPDDVRQQLIDYVHQINGQLKMFGMEIKKGVEETDGVGYYGLVNTTENSISLLASQYTDNELQFFKTLIELLVMSDTGSVGSIAAVNISDSLTKKMSKGEAEDLLIKFEKDHWLGKTSDGMIHLAARGTMELEQYILDMFGDQAARCNMCKKLCLQGQSCDQCDVKLHFHCSGKLFKDQAVKKCPECASLWQREVSVLTPQPSTSSASTPASRSSRKRKSQT